MKNELAQEVVAGIKKRRLARLKTPSQLHKEQSGRK